ncbi:protein of unknown function [Chitinophaga jiangningensis]|uniref:DUF4349 domain-containing protein n=1 Tax=Chitinophaga jiangningensis TaxID=1419482 RepID=A0A1M7ALD1_9BACT|nr:DUF4349 domain-containing protein [Chitinophaga jiangningensis]SHL43592.1 protein of unknown function [Chitinophaga jiangningensis]
MRNALPLWVLPALTLAACSSQRYEKDAPASEAVSAETVTAAADSTSFAADIASLNSASRKRIRTADVSCRVPDVFAASQALERVTKSLDGIVVESKQQNEISQEKYLPYKGDSLMHVRMYSTVASLTLRVPAAAMDSVVQVLTQQATYIDYRTLKDQDKTLDYLSNSLRNNAKTYTATADRNTSSVDAANYNQSKEDNTISRQLNNLAILDEANNATITVAMVQPGRADVLVEVDPTAATRAGFGTELKTALYTGADILRNIVLFFITIWPFVITGVVVWVMVKRFRKTSVQA